MQAVLETATAGSTTAAPVEQSKPIQIVPAFDNKVDLKDFKFHFKKDDLGNKRPTVELKLPCPSVEGVVNIVETGGKGLELLLSAAAEIIASQARSLLNDTESMNEASFPIDQCTWEAISLMPESEKRGRGIAKEIWEEFGKDYITAMPGLTGKTVEQVTLASKLFLNKYQQVKSTKKVIQMLRDQLAIYTNGAPNAETYQECVKFLDEKADSLLKADDVKLLEAL